MLIREGSRALAAGLDLRIPTGDELNLLGTGAFGLRPFAAVSGAWGSFAPHANLAYQWNGESVLAGDVRAGTKASLPSQFQYALGSDVAINPRFSMVFDVLGQRVLDSPRLSVYTLHATGAAGSADLPDIRFSTDSYWVTDASLGFKANVASRLLLNFNMRFNLGDKGLADRVAPLLGIEWSF